jgi:hypothetical protein
MPKPPLSSRIRSSYETWRAVSRAARHQPPVLSVPCGAGLWPAGCRQGWPAAGAGRAGSPRAGVGGKGRLIFLYSALTPRLGNRPYVRVLPRKERFQ